MTWAKSFRELYVERCQCAPDRFEAHLLPRALHRRAFPFLWIIRKTMPGYFEMELRTIRYLGNSRSSEEFRANWIPTGPSIADTAGFCETLWPSGSPGNGSWMCWERRLGNEVGKGSRARNVER